MTAKTSNIENAIELALRAHKGQKDKAGAPYIFHPLRIMLAMDTDAERQAAVLHDVIEDRGVTPEMLRSKGFSEDVCSAVTVLTKTPGESYNEYLCRVNENPIARKVRVELLKFLS